MNRRRPASRALLAFFILEFVIVIVALTFLQISGLEAYAARVAGFVGGVAAVLGSLLLWRPLREGPQNRTELP